MLDPVHVYETWFAEKDEDDVVLQHNNVQVQVDSGDCSPLNPSAHCHVKQQPELFQATSRERMPDELWHIDDALSPFAWLSSFVFIL